jgi:hypothetical protein
MPDDGDGFKRPVGRPCGVRFRSTLVIWTFIVPNARPVLTAGHKVIQSRFAGLAALGGNFTPSSGPRVLFVQFLEQYLQAKE